MGEFDGSKLDCFGSTSLHLTFTDWSASMYSGGEIGQRDSEATHAEAVVSVRDSGLWVADINILAALRHPNVYRSSETCETCGHPQPTMPPAPVMSIETWDQILDCSEGILVTRATGNWVARLAIVSVLANHCKPPLKRIVICPENVCWECVKLPVDNVIYVY